MTGQFLLPLRNPEVITGALYSRAGSPKIVDRLGYRHVTVDIVIGLKLQLYATSIDGQRCLWNGVYVLIRAVDRYLREQSRTSQIGL